MNSDFKNCGNNDDKNIIAGDSQTCPPPSQYPPPHAPDTARHNPPEFTGLSGSVPDETSRMKFLDLIPIGIEIARPDGTVIYANEALQKMTGYSLDELKRVAGLYVKPDGREKMLKTLEMNGRLENFEIEMKRGDGSTFVSLVNADIVERDGEKIIFKTVRDITERERATEILRRSEERFRMVVENMPAGAVICEKDSISVNSYIEELTGYSRDELKDPKTFFNKLFRDNAAMIERTFSARSGGSDTASLSVELYNKEGGVRIVEISKMNVDANIDVWIFHDVTDYLFVQQKVMKSEAHLTEIQHMANLGSYECDLKSGKITWSDNCYRIMGLKKQKVTFGLIKSLIHPEDIDEYYSHYFDLFSKNADFDIKYRVIKPDGRIINIKDRARIKYNDLKKPVSCTGYYMDVTESKILEKSLSESEERYRMLFETSRLGIVYQDAGGRIISSNPAAESILGLTKDQISGRTSVNPEWKSIHEDGSEFPGETHPAMLALGGGKPVHDVVMGVFNPRKERYVWINISAVPLFRKGETKPWQVYVIFEDITEKKQKDDELRRIELQKMQLIESAHEGYCAVNKDRKIVFVNNRMCEISGYSKEEMLGRDLLEFFDDNNKKSNLTAFEICMAGERFSFSSETRHKDGHRVFVTISAAPALDDKGRPNGVFALINDTTKEKALENEIRSVRYELAAKHSFNSIIGKSEPVMAIFESLPAIAEADCNVLLEGESGTGKNLFAKVIYDISNRNGRPFVVVNCGALPENLLESELFGYVKGAFTGAERDKPGKFAAAEGGMIFLDEIGELPLNLQVKLLRVIEEKQYEPIGSNKTVRSDVRIIAATNRDLKAMAEEGKFRPDLYFRLKIVSITIPSLKDRPEDISVLTEFFIENFNKKYDKNIDCVSDDVIRFFKLYDFPGNVRELKNIIEHAFIFCNSEILQMQHLPSEYNLIAKNLFSQSDNGETVLRNSKTIKPKNHKKESTQGDTAEKELLIKTLDTCKGNKTHAAKELKIDRTTLWRKLKKHGLI